MRSLLVGKDEDLAKIRSFYYTQWLPFTSNKKRILLLAILSYIALC